MNKTIELFKEDMKFSVAHFTIFSATERENIHGHNYQVKFSLTLGALENGMAFNYQAVKTRIREICQRLDERFILQMNSPYLNITKDNETVFVTFNNKRMSFLESDVFLLPVVNTTLECLGSYVLEELIKGLDESIKKNISRIGVTISSGPGQVYTEESKQ